MSVSDPHYIHPARDFLIRAFACDLTWVECALVCAGIFTASAIGAAGGIFGL